MEAIRNVRKLFDGYSKNTQHFYNARFGPITFSTLLCEASSPRTIPLSPPATTVYDYHRRNSRQEIRTKRLRFVQPVYNLFNNFISPYKRLTKFKMSRTTIALTIFNNVFISLIN